MKKAFITGITGQDGSYLAELLLTKGYEVHAMVRPSSVCNLQRISRIKNNENLFTYHGDLTDSSNLYKLIRDIAPTEIYNLAAQSHVGVSFEVPEYTGEVSGLGVMKLLTAIKDSGVETKFYQASTSELFGGLPETSPQDEKTPFYPKSPYAAAKLYSYWVTVNFRESYDFFGCNGILFNHESPRRGESFVTKKITKAVANIVNKKQNILELGNLDSRRDWGHAKDYVEAMWLMLQQKKPDDFVIATGCTNSVREFVNKAFKVAEIEITWHGEGVDEVGIDQASGERVVRINPKFYRPSEVELLCGNASKAHKNLNWHPKYDLDQIIKEMVDYDLKYETYGWD